MQTFPDQFGDSGSRKSHLDRFIELTARAATEDYLEEGKHFTFVNAGDPDEQLALKLSSVHDRVSKYVRDHGLDAEDLLNSAGDYRDRMSEAAEDNASYVVTHSQYTPPLARCARINTEMAGEELEFSRTAFGAEPRDDEAAEGDSDDGGPDPDAFNARQLTHVAEDPTGYATVTVNVLTVEQPENDSAPALKATVKDTSTAIDVISWNDPEALPPDGAVVLENVQVGKHNGQVQLTIRDGVTEVRSIQQGVGYTEAAETEDDQESLSTSEETSSTSPAVEEETCSTTAAETDGGSAVPEDAEGMLADARRLTEQLEKAGTEMAEGEITAKAATEWDLFPPDRAKEVLQYAASKRGFLVETEDGYQPA